MEAPAATHLKPDPTRSADPLSVIDSVIAAHRDLPGALIPMLHGIQDQLGFVPPNAIPRLASALNLSQAEVHGVLSFYHDFRTHPPGRHVVRLCRAEACQAMGCEKLEAHLHQKWGLAFNETLPDHSATLEPVYCLGNCACSPSALIDGELRGRVSTADLDAWLLSFQRESGGRP